MSLADVLLIATVVFMALLLAYTISFKFQFVNPWHRKEEIEQACAMRNLEQAAEASVRMTESNLRDSKAMIEAKRHDG